MKSGILIRGRRSLLHAHTGNAATIHLFYPQKVRAAIHSIPTARNAVLPLLNISSQRFNIRGRRLYPEAFRKISQGKQTGHGTGTIRQDFNRGTSALSGRIKLILNLAHQFLQNILKRHHARRLSILIDQNSQMFALTLLMIGAGIRDSWMVMIAVFLFMGAQIENRSAVFQSVLEQIRMEDVMLTDFKTLSPADTLEDALHKVVHSLQDDFPVVRGGDMVGTISRQRIMETLRAQGNGYVQGAMNRFFQIAQRNETLASVFRRIGQTGMSIVPVVDGEHLVGIVTLQNLMHSMSTLAEARKLKQPE